MLRRVLFQVALPAVVLLGMTSPCPAQMMAFPGRGGFGIGIGGTPAGWGGYPMMGFGSGIGISRGMPGGPYYSGYNYGGYYDYTPAYYNYDARYYAYPQTPPITDSDVILDVRVPSAAQVWVNGELTTQTGSERHYTTNDLTPGRTYTYSIKARWMADGKPVEYERKVKVRGGEERLVNFRVPH